jgi:hypothetical protein
LASADTLENLEILHRTFAARRAFAARFDGDEFKEETGHIDHAGSGIHHDRVGQNNDGPILATGPSSTRVRAVRGFALRQIE